jgi:hypothetical protein
MQFALQPPNFEVMGTMLFNRKFEVGRLNFQGSFNYLCNNLPSTFTSESFLYSNTIFPLFIPFISKEKHEKSIEYFKGDYPDKINKCLRISDITKAKTFIRICKECIKEDFNTYGEPYFRRQHEIELNRMCYKHKIPLYEYTIFPYKIPRKYDDCYTVLKNLKELTIPEKFKGNFFDIAEDINAIFTLNLDNWSIDVTKDKLSNRIAEKGYVTVAGSILQQKFSADFKRHYTDEFLDFIGYNFDINENDCWLRHTTTRKKAVGDPLKFILVIRYLFGSFKEFYQYNKEYSMFKKGPYPCLNIVCPNYNTLVIKDIMQITNSHGYPLANFKCDHCGFKYSRRGPDKNDYDIFTKTYVKEYGPLWHDKLKECIDKDFSIRKISKMLGCHSHEKLKTLCDKYKNLNLVKMSSVEFLSRPDDVLIEQYENEILKFIKESTTTTILDIYKLNLKAYKYLSETDKQWITSTLQFIKDDKIISKEERLKNYWANKDELIATALLKAIRKITSEKILYDRLTIAVLQKYTGHYNLHQNRDKLPRCFQIIEKACESIPAYQKRRINYVIKQMADNSGSITVAKVLRNAGITTGRVNQEVFSYVEKIINDHNSGNIITIESNDF